MDTMSLSVVVFTVDLGHAPWSRDVLRDIGDFSPCGAACQLKPVAAGP